MSLSWPWALALLLLVPLLLLLRWWLRRRRRRAAVRVTSIALVRAALPGRSRRIRLLPAVLLVLGLVVLGVGAARPQASVAVPSTKATIMLAIDESGSMCSTDVDPNRITAAERAATAFVKSVAGGPRIGLVAFAGAAGVLVPPTDDTGAVLKALDQLSTSRGTAIGQGILVSLDALAQADPDVAPTGATARGGSTPDAIVVLTDGANTQGVAPATAAKQAAARHVRVFTIGFGTTTPTRMACTSAQVGSGGWSGGFGGFGGGFGGRNVLQIDEGVLRTVASTTGGTYYRAKNAAQLNAAFRHLPGRFALVKQDVDLASWFALAGGILVIAAVGLSLRWNRVRRRREAPAA